MTGTTEMDRLLNRFLEGQSEEKYPAGAEWAPSMDISETKDSLIAKLEVPGMDPFVRSVRLPVTVEREQGGGELQERPADRDPAQDPDIQGDDHPDQNRVTDHGRLSGPQAPGPEAARGRSIRPRAGARASRPAGSGPLTPRSPGLAVIPVSTLIHNTKSGRTGAA